MRALTKYPLFTKGGEPLDGSIKVTIHGGTELASLYDVNGNALSNPYLIADGLPETQIFVDDVDVDVEVLDDTSARVFSYVDLANATIEGVTTSSIVGIATVADMRLATAEEGATVILLGYNALGDKPALTFTLVHDGSLSDDGGLVLASAVTDYYWVAKTSGVVDVRHYNVFPNNANTLPNLNVRWYFPYVSASAYTYNIDGLSLDHAETDANVVLQANSSRAYLTDCDVYTCKGYITLVANTLRTSVVGGLETNIVLEPRDTLIIDSHYNGADINLSGINVIGSVEQTGQVNWTFARCKFSGIGFVSHNGYWTFVQCGITEAMLSSSFEWDNATFTNCTASSEYWPTADMWFLAQQHILNIAHINMGGQTVTSDIELSAETWIEDAFIQGDIVKNGYYVHCKDCHFANQVEANTGDSFEHCEFNALLTIGVDDNELIYDVTVNNCDIGDLLFSAGSSTYVNQAYVTNNRITGSITRTGVWASAQGKYVIANNSSVSTLNFDNTMRALRKTRRTLTRWTDWNLVDGNIQFLTLKVKDLVWSFGESTNTCPYGFTAVETEMFGLREYGGTETRVYDGSEVSSSTYYWTADGLSRYHNDHKTWTDVVPFTTSGTNNIDTVIAYDHHADDGTWGTLIVTYDCKPVKV